MSIIERALERKKRKVDEPAKDNQPQDTSVSASPEALIADKLIDQKVPEEQQSSTQQVYADQAVIRPDESNHVNIDLQRLRALGMITPDMRRSQIAEEFRLIKRPLLNNAAGKGATVVPNGNLIMVTSSLPGEGKTFTSVNLAMSIALEMDKTVLLVDADVAKPSVAKLFGIRTTKGIVDYLSGEANSLSDILLQTNVPNLRILPSGKKHQHATELLASENMTSLLNELSCRYPDRIVIFDSPPLLATSESSVLANQAGQLVMVVEAEKTTQEVLKEALSMVDSSMIIGLVLNKSGQLFGSDYYGSYSEYGHGK